MSTPVQSRVWPIGLVLTLLVLLVPLGIAQSGGGAGSTIPVVKSGAGTCTIKAGDLDTANECIIPFSFTFHTLTTVVIQVNAESALWNQSYTIFNGNMSLSGIVGPISNQTEFFERGYTGVGEMMVHFRSDSAGNCEPSGAFIVDQFTPLDTGMVEQTWTNVGNGVKVDCGADATEPGGISLWDNAGFQPISCNSLIGFGIVYDCFNNSTITGFGINQTLTKNFQNSYNRLFLSTSAPADTFLYRVDLDLVYAEPIFCTVLFASLTNFTPECGPSLGIQLTHPFTVTFAWSAFGT